MQRAAFLMAPLGVLAFWCGIVLASRQYPSAYDWRYMSVSKLANPEQNPPGYLSASAGIVFCSLCGLWWTAALARRRDRAGDRPRGIRALQFGYVFMLLAVVVPEWLLWIEKGHEILAALAFLGLLIGMIRLMFRTTEQMFLKRTRWPNRRARVFAFIAASAAVLPIVLAGLAQAYFYYVPPEFHWITFSWSARGWPVILRFAFWEWATCSVLSACMVILSLLTRSVYSVRKADT